MLRRSRTRFKTLGMWAAIAAAVAIIAACGSSTGTPVGTAATSTSASTGAPDSGSIPVDIGKDDKANLTGAGATFPAPIYQAWFSDYHRVAPGVQVNYQSIGSGGGVQQFTAKTVDFGASDAPLSDEELAAAGPDTVHIPTVLGAVTVTYNVDGLKTPLRFDGDTLAKIYLGTITNWNDPAIAALNPDAKLPDATIQVVYRSDGSGTSYVWTDYLSHVSADWERAVGTSKNPAWPVGQGGKGNEGVTQIINQTRNSIGYVELAYATINEQPVADIKNQAGKFVAPSIDATSAAAAGVDMPADYRLSIVDAAGEAAYPIASFTYLLVRQDAASCSTEAPLVRLLWWAYHDPGAQATARSLFYAPIPAAVQPKIDATLKSLQCEGKPIL